MGCLSLQFLKLCRVGPPKIKVMTVDGKCLKYEDPSIVKEVLMEYPLHALFESETVRALGDRARPLKGSLYLQPGHLYFLVPQAMRNLRCTCTPEKCNLSSAECACTTSACEMSSLNCMHSTSSAALSKSDLPDTQVNDASSQSMPAAKCSLPKRKVSFAAAPTVESTKSSVQFLPSPSDGVLRVKMVVSKRQLASVLKEGGDCVSVVEGLLSPLLEASRSDAAFSACNDISSNLSWRPSLESIPESSWQSQRATKNAT